MTYTKSIYDRNFSKEPVFISQKEKKSKRGKIWLCVLVLLFISLAVVSQIVVCADNNSSEQELLENIETQINNLDFSNIEEVVSSLDADIKLFDGSFKDKVSAILSGEYFDDYSNVFSAVLGIFLINLFLYCLFS